MTFEEKIEATPKAAETVKAAMMIGSKRSRGFLARPDRQASIAVRSRHAPSCAVSELRNIACRWWYNPSCASAEEK